MMLAVEVVAQLLRELIQVIIAALVVEQEQHQALQDHLLQEQVAEVVEVNKVQLDLVVVLVLEEVMVEQDQVQEQQEQLILVVAVVAVEVHLHQDKQAVQV